MKQFARLAGLLVIATACTTGDHRSPTAPESGLASARQPAGSIVITDLGTIGGNTSDAVSLNTPSAGNRLLIVGSNSDKAGTPHAAYWYFDMTTGARQAGALPAAAGEAQSGAWNVNQAEQIVGRSLTTVGGLGKPVQWGSSTSPPSFLNMTGFTDGGAWKITPTGQSMGEVGNSSGSQASIWDGENLALLPGLGGSTFIEDANDAGVIVGISKYNSTDAQRAAVWINGSIAQLPDGGSNSFAMGINAAGIIVGTDWTSGTGSRAVRWLPPTSPDGPYTMENLGISGYAYDINNAGEIVGMNCTPGQVCKPFYWLNGVSKDLPMLLPVRGGGARAINENGDVVGWSRLPSNYQHAVLWTHVR